MSHLSVSGEAETETETKPGLRLRDSLRLSGCQSGCQDIFRLTHNLQFAQTHGMGPCYAHGMGPGTRQQSIT